MAGALATSVRLRGLAVATPGAQVGVGAAGDLFVAHVRVLLQPAGDDPGGPREHAGGALTDHPFADVGPFAFVERWFEEEGQDPALALTLLDSGCAGERHELTPGVLVVTEGEQTAYLKSVLAFQSEYHAHHLRTQAFCRRLSELDLLEPMDDGFKIPDGRAVSLRGFHAIDRAKLRELPGDVLEEMSRTGELELAYAEVYSLSALAIVLERSRETDAG